MAPSRWLALVREKALVETKQQHNRDHQKTGGSHRSGAAQKYPTLTPARLRMDSGAHDRDQAGHAVGVGDGCRSCRRFTGDGRLGASPTRIASSRGRRARRASAPGSAARPNCYCSASPGRCGRYIDAALRADLASGEPMTAAA